MPRCNGTGPVGMGPFTGWGRGNCIAPYESFQRARNLGTPRRMRTRMSRAAGDDSIVTAIRRLEESIEELKLRMNDKAE